VTRWVTAMIDFGDLAALDPAKHRRLFKLVDKLGAVVKAATVAHLARWWPRASRAAAGPGGGRTGRPD
jgi:hypothetical protein